jgi:hypothetical protein
LLAETIGRETGNKYNRRSSRKQGRTSRWHESIPHGGDNFFLVCIDFDDWARLNFLTD